MVMAPFTSPGGFASAKLCAWNIAGADCHESFEELSARHPEMKLAGFSETWVTSDKCIKPFPTQYRSFVSPATRSVSGGRPSGGLLLVICKSLCPMLLNVSISHITVKLVLWSGPLLFTMIYLCPGTDYMRRL